MGKDGRGSAGRWNHRTTSLVAPCMSRVVVATGFGGPEVLSVVDEPVREPQDGQVRIAVRTAGVNPIDYKLYGGMFGTDPAQLPLHIGNEAAGTIAAVGARVDGFVVGDAVMAYPAPGAYAAELVVPVSSVIAKPAELPWDQAGGLLLTGATAVHLLTAAAVQRGDTVLIHGASGGVGHIAVQLAVARGATVLATASPSRHDLLRELGAVPIAYGDGLADRVRAAAPNGVDVALDLVGTDEAVDVSLELVADRSRIVTIAAFARAAAAGIVLIGGGPGADPGTEIRNKARTELAASAASGALRVIVARTFPLEQAADAHREIMTGHAAGKIVLTV
jgi:NADPH:quinone reductase